MGSLNSYKINLLSLNDGLHEYTFEVDDKFFARFEDSLVQHGKVEVSLKIKKRINLLITTFHLKGFVQLVCDRSLEEFDYPINHTYTLHFKYADSFEEISDEIIHIPFGLPQLDLLQYIYEYVGISVPMKKIHPKFAEEGEYLEEEFEEVYSTEEDISEDSTEDSGEIDPRWEILKKLKK